MEDTLPFSSEIQWAAVTTHWGWINEPPQNCPANKSVAEPPTRATCHGHSPGTDGPPPIICGSIVGGGSPSCACTSDVIAERTIARAINRIRANIDTGEFSFVVRMVYLLSCLSSNDIHFFTLLILENLSVSHFQFNHPNC